MPHFFIKVPIFPFQGFRLKNALSQSSHYLFSGTTKVRNSGLGPDPDLSAKSGPELVTRFGFFGMPLVRLDKYISYVVVNKDPSGQE